MNKRTNEQLSRNPLSDIEGTIGHVIKENYTEISKITSRDSLLSFMRNLFEDSSRNDVSRFLNDLAKKKDLMSMQLFVFNYMAAGDGLRAM